MATTQETMTLREKAFSPERAVEGILFILERLQAPTLHQVLKIRYFADKLHLEKFGVLGSGDRYVAMKFGPVASNTYSLLQAARGDESAYINPSFFDLVAGSISVSAKDGSVSALRAPRMEQIAPSDASCLTETIDRFGNLNFNDRTELSHDDAWTKAWDSKGDGVSVPMSLMDIAETLPNGEVVKAFISS